MKMDQINLRKGERKNNKLQGNQNGRKPRREREKINYNNGDYNGVLYCARASEIEPFLCWKGSPIYTGRVY